MKTRRTKISLASLAVSSLLLLGVGSSLAQSALPLTAAQKHAYHACLYSAYIDDYCRHNYQGWWSAFGQQYQECKIANGGGKYPIDGHSWGAGIEDYCRAAVQAER